MTVWRAPSPGCAIVSSAATFGAASIGEENGGLHFAAVRPGSAPLITVWKRYMALTVASSIVYVHIAGLVFFSPYERKRNRLCLGRKHEWLLGVATLYAPAR